MGTAGLLAVDITRVICGNPSVPWEEFWVASSALLPDVLDKGLYWSHQCHATRSFGHCTLFVLAWFAVGWALLGKAMGLIFFVSALSHLLVDLFFGYVPFFYPLQSFRYPSMIH